MLSSSAPHGVPRYGGETLTSLDVPLFGSIWESLDRAGMADLQVLALSSTSFLFSSYFSHSLSRLPISQRFQRAPTNKYLQGISSDTLHYRSCSIVPSTSGRPSTNPSEALVGYQRIVRKFPYGSEPRLLYLLFAKGRILSSLSCFLTIVNVA